MQQFSHSLKSTPNFIKFLLLLVALSGVLVYVFCYHLAYGTTIAWSQQRKENPTNKSRNLIKDCAAPDPPITTGPMLNIT